MYLKKSFARWMSRESVERECPIGSTIGRPTLHSRRPYHVELSANIGTANQARFIKMFIHPSDFEAVAKLMIEASPEKGSQALTTALAGAEQKR